MINILITSCGRRVELVKAFKATRDRLGIIGNVVCADCSNTAPALCFGDKKYIVPRISSGEYIDAIKQITVKEGINLIIPTIDTELKILADNKTEIEQLGTRVLIASPDVVRICGDKDISAEFFKAHGFDAPYTLTQEEAENYTGVYPLFIKPRDGSSSINAFKINNAKELNFFLRYMECPIVQQCVTGQEYTIDALTDFDGESILIVPRKRLATRSGEILKGQIDKNIDIINIVKRLIRKLGYRGQLTVQGFWSDGKFYLIEMNARFGGGAPMSIKAGADFCEKLYRMLRGEKLEYDESYASGMIIARFDDSIVME